MVWENGCVVIVMLTPVSESGVRQCYHYWPDEGSNLYHIYEVLGPVPLEPTARPGPHRLPRVPPGPPMVSDTQASTAAPLGLRPGVTAWFSVAVWGTHRQTARAER